MQGTEGELAVEDQIVSGQTIPELGSPATLVDSQVRIETSAGLRIVDLIVKLPTGELRALEVKTGGASRKLEQIEGDIALELEGGMVTGSQRGLIPKGKIEPIKTVVIQR